MIRALEAVITQVLEGVANVACKFTASSLGQLGSFTSQENISRVSLEGPANSFYMDSQLSEDGEGKEALLGVGVVAEKRAGGLLGVEEYGG